MRVYSYCLYYSLIIIELKGIYIFEKTKVLMRKGGLSYFAYMVVGIAVSAMLLYFAYNTLIKNSFG